MFKVPIGLTEMCKDALRDFDPVAEYRREKEIEGAKLRKKYKNRRRYDPLIARGFKSKKLVRRPNYLAKEKGVDFGPKRLVLFLSVQVCMQAKINVAPKPVSTVYVCANMCAVSRWRSWG